MTSTHRLAACGGAVTVQEKVADAVPVLDVAVTVKVCVPIVRPL